jgi:carboxyl-terminal processing protease
MLQIVMRRQQIFFSLALIATGLAVWVGCKTSRHTPPPVTSTATVGVVPGPNDAKIAFVTTRLLEGYHYLQHPFDQEMSKKAFDGYVDALDPRHENFLQSDMDEFSSIRTNLDVLMTGTRSRAELGPAFDIYNRFCERSVQHTAYACELLAKEKFKFTTDEKFPADRRHAAFPKTVDEAKQLWKQRVRYEYLLDKLANEIHETNDTYTIELRPNAHDAHTNIIANLDKRYRWVLRLTTNWSSDNVLQTFLNAGIAHAYDPHSDYFSAPKAADFNIHMNLALFGIGAQLSEDYGYCTIRELVPGGPAMKSKQIKKSDRIIAVAQAGKAPVDVVDMDLEKVVSMIRGPKGTEVRLTISPVEDQTARRVVTLVRDEIKLENEEATAQLIEYPNGQRIGVLELPSFYAPVGGPGDQTTPKYTSVDVTKLLNKLKSEKVQGIVLDLRGNPGGSLEEAVRFTGLFIKDGPVVLARDDKGKVAIDNDPDPDVVYGGPLVVMINRFSASAAEIAAAALQDYGRAIIVGDVSTHGKGTVQQLQRLQPFVWPASNQATNDPGTLKITKGKFYRISGTSTQLKGVNSDIVLPSIWNHSTQVGEAALDNALPCDSIDPASYSQFNLVAPFISELQSRSLDRVATNQEFVYARQDIETFTKAQADKTATMNEQQAIAERERDARKNHARDRERDARPLPTVKIYELTVKNSELPGLPEPKPFFTTNYSTNDFSISNGKILPHVTYAFDSNYASFFSTNMTTAAGNKPSPESCNTAFVYTNYFSDATLSFTDFFRTNFVDMDAGKIIYTKTSSTNVIAEIVNPITGTNIIIKPVIAKSISYDGAIQEGQNILRDYISLLSKSGMLTASHQP